MQCGCVSLFAGVLYFEDGIDGVGVYLGVEFLSHVEEGVDDIYIGLATG